MAIPQFWPACSWPLIVGIDPSTTWGTGAKKNGGEPVWGRK